MKPGDGPRAGEGPWRKKIDASGLRSTLKGVLHAFVRNADWETGKAWPSVQTLAKRAGLKKRATQRALRELEALGVLIPEEPPTGGRSRTRPRRLVWDALAGECREEKGCTGALQKCTDAQKTCTDALQKCTDDGKGRTRCTPGAHEMHPKGARDAPQRAHEMHPKGCTRCTRTNQENQPKEPTTEHTSGEPTTPQNARRAADDPAAAGSACAGRREPETTYQALTRWGIHGKPLFELAHAPGLTADEVEHTGRAIQADFREGKVNDVQAVLVTRLRDECGLPPRSKQGGRIGNEFSRQIAYLRKSRAGDF